MFSQWPRGLRRSSAAARCMELWVRTSPGAWMFVCVVTTACCQVEISASGWSLVHTCPSVCGLCNWVWLCSIDNEVALAHKRLLSHEKISHIFGSSFLDCKHGWHMLLFPFILYVWKVQLGVLKGIAFSLFSKKYIRWIHQNFATVYQLAQQSLRIKRQNSK